MLPLLRHNWPIKLASLVTAILLAFFVRRQQDTISTTLFLPVNVPPRPGYRVAEPAPGTFVRVNVDGPAELVRAVDNDDIKLVLETENIGPNRSMSVPVEVQLAERYRDRLVLSWWPRSVPVRFISDITRTMQVELSAINQPRGWEYAEAPRVEPASVRVSGPANVMAQLGSVTASFARELQPRLEELVTVQVLDRQGRDVGDLVQVEPLQVRVLAVQRQAVVSKPVPVQPIFVVPPGLVPMVTVNPPYVQISGSEDELTQVYFVETQLLVLPQKQKQVERDVAITRPSPGLTVQPSHVHVTLSAKPAP